jgi:DNA-binding response OmpR family regulator
MAAKVLVVEDEPAWSTLVRKILEKQGYVVEIAENADTAADKIKGEQPDLVILDVSLRGISGFDLCKMLRGDPLTAGVRILMLTAMTEVKDKVRGLQLGADDYLSKPFDREELLARVQALLRRAQDVTAAPEGAGALTAKKIVVDVDRHEILVDGKPVKFSRKEFDLLALFVKNKGRLLRKEFLAEAVWGKDFLATSQTIAQHIKNLRAKLGPLAASIETIDTLGYRFND